MFFFRIILFLLLIYLILTSVGRFFIGIRRSSKVSGGDHTDARREGDVSVQFDSKRKKKISKESGEYVNYEEVD
jgi:hypothetical protein